MHIPDGSISPSTCAVLYAAAVPFWYVALQRLQRLLNTRTLPLVSVCAAFSFVVMMFNLPLPGGTSGHAVGVGICAIVLGPWAAILAVSVALMIQALLFGDGGITALGANCFNMAIVGSLVAYGVYRAVAGRAPLGARRRVVAAALAGYAAMNAAALLTGCELGLQAMLFKDADGAPLYFPYPMQIAVPVMVLFHLTFAGLAEMFVTAGLIAYFQRTNPGLLQRTAGLETTAPSAVAVGGRTTRPLWVGLALLMIATPLGLLAGVKAWGEWGPEDFTDPEQRAKIEAASLGARLPDHTPSGLEELSGLWPTPIPDYEPPFLQSKEFGYMMAAMLGVGVILLVFLAIGLFFQSRPVPQVSDTSTMPDTDQLRLEP